VIERIFPRLLMFLSFPLSLSGYVPSK
jgi:hypothetical protein